MAQQKSGFQSRSEREKEEALCCRYRSIGISAVAAAKTALQHKRSPAQGGQSRLDWSANEGLDRRK